jgi:hypothetical protein
VIVDPNGAPVSGFTPFTELADAMQAARAHGTRNTVMKVQGATKTPMAHQGPGGWSPRAKKGLAA